MLEQSVFVHSNLKNSTENIFWYAKVFTCQAENPKAKGIYWEALAKWRYESTKLALNLYQHTFLAPNHLCYHIGNPWYL